MDLSKIHPDHRALIKSVIDDEFGVGYTEQQKQQLYNTYVEVNKIPKKDWDKPEVIKKVKNGIVKP